MASYANRIKNATTVSIPRPDPTEFGYRAKLFLMQMPPGLGKTHFFGYYLHWLRTLTVPIYWIYVNGDGIKKKDFEGKLKISVVFGGLVEYMECTILDLVKKYKTNMIFMIDKNYTNDNQRVIDSMYSKGWEQILNHSFRNMGVKTKYSVTTGVLRHIILDFPVGNFKEFCINNMKKRRSHPSIKQGYEEIAFDSVMEHYGWFTLPEKLPVFKFGLTEPKFMDKNEMEKTCSDIYSFMIRAVTIMPPRKIQLRFEVTNTKNILDIFEVDKPNNWKCLITIYHYLAESGSKIPQYMRITALTEKYSKWTTVEMTHLLKSDGYQVLFNSNFTQDCGRIFHITLEVPEGKKMIDGGNYLMQINKDEFDTFKMDAPIKCNVSFTEIFD